MTDHGMTNAELSALPVGTELHFTNWPGVPSKPVTLVSASGEIRFPSGIQLYAFADELSREPRAGLGE